LDLYTLFAKRYRGVVGGATVTPHMVVHHKKATKRQKTALLIGWLHDTMIEKLQNDIRVSAKEFYVIRMLYRTHATDEP
jgi:hypothetical protein